MRQAGWQEKFGKKTKKSLDELEIIKPDLGTVNIIPDVNSLNQVPDLHLENENSGGIQHELNQRINELLGEGKQLNEVNKFAQSENNSGNKKDVNGVDSLEKAQAEILAKLADAKKAEERVKVFALLMDKFGLDTLIGTFIPVKGDIASSIAAGLYLCFEARNANLKGIDYLKIIGLQGADIAIGAIPVIGDIADYALMANQLSVPFFTKKVEELEQEALKAGVPKEEITKLYENASALPQLLSKPIAIGIEKLNEFLKEKKTEGQLNE